MSKDTTNTAPSVHLLRMVQLTHEQERSYLEEVFNVPADVESIEVHYRYPKNDRSVIDLGLRSPTRIMGWSGGARTGFHIGKETATPGYLAGPLGEGEWAVLLGAYRVPENGITVELEITMILKHPHWLKGDLHAHTIHSDGSYSIGEAMASCREQGLDFLALTDHNTSSQNQAVTARDERLLLIPGVEMTSYFGHVNLLGHMDALTDFRRLTPEAAATELTLARNKGALVSLNHPFCPDCPWELGFDAPYDAIEVWNGPWRELNERAVAWWQQQLSEGRRVVAVGGSDTHRVDTFIKHGSPTAYVHALENTAAGVLEGIRCGAVVLSHRPDDIFMTLSAGDQGVGQEVEIGEREEVELLIMVRGARQDCVTLWSDHGPEMYWMVEQANKWMIHVPADRLFYRLEARRSLPEQGQVVMTCLTNPLYLVRDPSKEHS